MLLSIVIPVYNGAKNISKCLDSIWTQNMNEYEYEVICVDDCSTDNTTAVLEKIKQEHDNLRIIKNDKNRRAGGSRNHGVLEAKGEYVVFIDSDDYFHHESLNKALMYLQENQLDILVCDFAREKYNEPNNTLVHNFKNRELLSGKDFMISNGLPYAPWKYIFKRSVMIKNCIYFEECVSAEDVDWTHNMAMHANKMQYIPLLLTHYRLNPASQTAQEFKSLRLIRERFFAGYRVHRLSVRYKADDSVASHLKNVSDQFFHTGLVFMTAIYCNTKKKRDTILEYIPADYHNDRLIEFASKHPLLYAILSNMMSPFVKPAIIIKRYIKGR